MFLFWDRLNISKIHRKSCRNYHPKNILQNMQKFLGISFMHGKGPRTLAVQEMAPFHGDYASFD